MSTSSKLCFGGAEYLHRMGWVGYHFSQTDRRPVWMLNRDNLCSWLLCVAIAAHFLTCHTGDNSQQVEHLM